MTEPLTQSDRDFLRSIHVVADEENFLLEALWLNWSRANCHRDFSACDACGAATGEQHALDCQRGAAMVFVDPTLDADQRALVPEVSSETNQTFFPNDMQNRWEKLKAAGKVPPLADILKVVSSTPHDPTLEFMKANNLPVNRENYLAVAYLGNPPKELGAETEAELPDTTGGECGEPSRTTIRGIPICSECGKSTRNRNMILCAPCRKGTRLLLTTEDKKWLREIGIAR